MTPFVKWVGGKRKVIEKYLRHILPKKYNTFIEPFVGGGAMFFYLEHNNSIINDLNSELITTYKVIKKNKTKLMKELDSLNKYKTMEDFLKIRSIEENDDIKKAARFIYLNKKSFNGMYRVNSLGKFNVPYNPSSTNSTLYNRSNIEEISFFLKKSNTKIYNKDYAEIIDMAKKNDFIFCDPPYDYEEGTNGFISYTKNGFNQEKQIELANKLKEAHSKGVKWMLTNHNTKLINELYKDFNINPITTDRMINSVASKRKGTGKEVVITNYEH